MTKISNQYSLTNILTADLANSRLGINNVSPTVALDVTGAGKFSGALTGSTASFSSNVTAIDYINVKKDGSDTAFSGAYLAVSNAANNVSWGWQLGASNKLSLWLYNGGPTSNPLNITSAGNVGIGTTTPTAYGFAAIVGSTTISSLTGVVAGFSDAVNGTTRIYIQSGVNGISVDQAFAVSTGGGSPTERMRITSAGNALIGTTTDDGYKLVLKTNSTGDTDGLIYMKNSANTASVYMFCATNTFMNTSDATMWMKRNGTTSRSINASGSINALGTDYAEYMLKSNVNDIIDKGDIVGVNINGLLTNIFEDSISFVVKTTNPSFVGGDTWFNIEPPIESNYDSIEEFNIAYGQFNIQKEEARQKVDRIAFSGQVPCNVLGANVGDYIIAINDNGKIKGQAVSNPTFEQYQNSVGKVWKIMDDGRAWLAVKIG